jgi:hypothetical protein
MDLVVYVDGFITCAERALQDYAHWEGYGDSIIEDMIFAKEAVLLEKSEDSAFVWLCPTFMGSVDMKYKQMYCKKVYDIIQTRDAFDKVWAVQLGNYTTTHW